jgi:hypothetical protein
MSTVNWFLLASDLGVEVQEQRHQLPTITTIRYTLQHQGRMVTTSAMMNDLAGQTAALNEAARKLLTHIYNLSEQ